ncbi:MAG: hypothetical protein WBX38_02540 [Candidatus Sulfotelmatobacter sp.]
MKRTRLLVLSAVFAVTLNGCSGRSSITPAIMPNISGAWEFVANSTTNPGYTTNIEVALQQGQILVDGDYQENGQLTASSQQISFVGFAPSGSIVFGGNCASASTPTANSLTGNLSGLGGTLSFTYSEDGNIFQVNAVLDASGQTIDSGTYTEQAAAPGQSNGVCNGSTDQTVIDTGSVTGKSVSKLSGTYMGKLCEPLDATCANTPDAATASLSQSGATLTMNLLLSGADDTSFTLTGPVTANAFSVQGTFQGQTLTYYGYYGLTYDSSDNSNDIQTLYLVNATNSAQPAYAGTLKIPLV